MPCIQMFIYECFYFCSRWSGVFSRATIPMSLSVFVSDLSVSEQSSRQQSDSTKLGYFLLDVKKIVDFDGENAYLWFLIG